jgi:hypothetical protein
MHTYITYFVVNPLILWILIHRYIQTFDEFLTSFFLNPFDFTVDIFSGEPGESAQLRFALENVGRISSDLGEFRPLFSQRICWLGEISPKSKEICPKFSGRNLTARIRPFRARKIITVFSDLQRIKFELKSPDFVFNIFTFFRLLISFHLNYKLKLFFRLLIDILHS